MGKVGPVSPLFMPSSFPWRFPMPGRLTALITALATFVWLPFQADAAPPRAPGALQASITFPLASPASGTAAYHVYLFEWEDRSGDEHGFELFARVGSVAPFLSLGNIAGNSTLVTTRLNVFTGGTKLEFKIRAYKGTEYSGFSNISSVTIPATADFSPPTGLAVTNQPRDSIKLTWLDNAEQEDYYVVEFKLQTDANWKFYALPYFNIEAFTLNDSLDPGSVYQFRVRGLRLQSGTNLAIDPSTKLLAHATTTGNTTTYSTDKLVYSPPTDIITHTGPELNSVPTQFTGSALDEDTIRLNWYDGSDKEGGYEVQYKEPGGATFTTTTYTPANGTSYEVNTSPGTSFIWRVRAAYLESDNTTIATSPFTSEVTVTTPFFGPNGLVVTPSPDSDIITLTWADKSKVESGFKIFARFAGDAQTPSEIKSVSVANTTTTTISDLVSGRSLEFFVAAYYNTGTGTILSDLSSGVTASTRGKVTSRSYQSIAPGQAFSYQATVASTRPVVLWSAEGLPAGLSIHASTGMISGIATGYGVFPVTIRATFSDGASHQISLTLRSVRPPGAPVALPAGNRTIAPGSTLSIPLASLFSDPDAEEAVRLTTNLGNSIDVILYPSATPLTVANFLAYTDAGDYNGVSFHRTYASGSIDIIQGGAFKPDTVSGTDTFTDVPARPAVVNEAGISNRPGTIAMAKIGGNPDSATHDFFFNRVDSSSLSDANALDNQNGGFTVFGRIAGGGMSVVNQIASLPKSSYAISVNGQTATYNDWPINDSTAPSTMDNTKNVVITNAARIPVMGYQITGNSNSAEVTAVINGNNLDLSGPTAGTSSVIEITATDLDGSTQSQTFTVQVAEGYVPPSITLPPTAVTATLGTNASFSVTASGTGPLSYQWRKNGTPLPGKTSNPLSLDAVTYADEGTYTVAVTNQGGTVVSAGAALTVEGVPAITKDPSSLTRTFGYSATFTVTATGHNTGSFQYQWYRGATLIQGANSPTFTIPSITMTDAGSYRVTVTNSSGTATSGNATLTVQPIDSDGDGAYDHQELAGNLNRSSTDTDGDGYDDGVEVAFGGDALRATRKPTAFFVARADGGTALESLVMKRVPAGSFVHSLDGGTKSIAPFWMAAYELTNREFASVLQYAYAQNLIQIVPGSRRSVVYQTQPICQLATHLATDAGNAGSEEVNFSDQGGFYVPSRVADFPARGVTWYGAYLSTVVLNRYLGYPGKNVELAFTFASAATNGYFLPSDAEWEWAARSGAANRFYPTGSTVSAALANFGSNPGRTARVNSYPANAFGIFNLGGNVSEWLGEVITPTSDAYARGGSWLDPASQLENVSRATLPKNSLVLPTGVRIALIDDRAPTFATPPASQLVSTSGPLNISAVAAGAPRITGQWFKNNVAVRGQTRPVFSIPAPRLSDAGTYKVTITNSLGTVTSSDVLAAVVAVPTAPQAVTTSPGTPVTFRVPYAGSGLTFQWKKDGTNITDDATYDIESPTAFQSTATLKVNSPDLPSAGRYTCIVTSPAPSTPTLTLTFDLTVISAPSLGNASPAATILNATYQFDVPYDTHPLRKPTFWSISGLPKGLSFDRITGRISGQPVRSGTFVIFATAGNQNSQATTAFQLVVQSLNAETVGNFVGLVDRNALNSSLGGRIDLKTTAAGSYSGTLTLGASPYRFSGVLNASVNSANGATVGGNASFVRQIVRRGIDTVELSLTLNSSTKLITGTLNKVVPSGQSAPASAAVNGWRSTFSATNFPATTRLGRHNFILDIPPALDDNPQIPQGFSYGWADIAKDGSVSVTGKLSDGSDFSSAGPLGPSGQILIYRLLHTNLGSLHGTLQVAANANHVVTGTTTWRRPVISTSRLYPDGLLPSSTSPMSLTATGGLYTPPTASQLIMGIPGIVEPNTAEFIRLTFSNGGFSDLDAASRLDVPTIELRPTALITMPPRGTANPAGATLTVFPKTGLFSGAITVIDGAVSRPEAFQGVIVRDQDTKLRGYGYFIMRQLPTGNQTLRTSPQLSGSVILDEKP